MIHPKKEAEALLGEPSMSKFEVPGTWMTVSTVALLVVSAVCGIAVQLLPSFLHSFPSGSTISCIFLLPGVLFQPPLDFSFSTHPVYCSFPKFYHISQKFRVPEFIYSLLSSFLIQQRCRIWTAFMCLAFKLEPICHPLFSLLLSHLKKLCCLVESFSSTSIFHLL